PLFVMEMYCRQGGENRVWIGSSSRAPVPASKGVPGRGNFTILTIYEANHYRTLCRAHSAMHGSTGDRYPDGFSWQAGESRFARYTQATVRLGSKGAGSGCAPGDGPGRLCQSDQGK